MYRTMTIRLDYFINIRRFSTMIFIKKWAYPGLFLVYFRPFLITISIIQIEKSIDGVLGVQTHGRMMVGALDYKELWRPPTTKKICPMIFAKIDLWTAKIPPNAFKILPKWQNVAQSGHTGLSKDFKEVHSRTVGKSKKLWEWSISNGHFN